MNVAIIGTGNVGKIYLSILKKNKKINKIYFVDKFENPKKNIISFNKFKNLQNVKIHYAFICSPSNLHYEHAKFFLKRKIPTLIEKPFVLKLCDANKLVKLSKLNKVTCYTVFQNRFNASLIELKKKILNLKKTKKIFYVDFKLFWKRDKIYYSDGWHGKYKSDGGVLTNQAIHMLDIMITFFGKINGFNCSFGFNKKKLQAEDFISIKFEMLSGVIINFVSTTRADFNYEVSIDVISSSKRYKVEGISMNKFYIYKKGKKTLSKKNSEYFSQGHGIHHTKLINLFLKNKLKEFSIEKNIYTLKVIHSIYNQIKKKDNLFPIKSKQSILGL
jgi:UDP-N-acetyl-2-amino-2-deoxyglucuronate dehydrogenase